MCMEFKLSTVVSKEGKLYVARGVEIELASQGKTIEEALKNLKEAVQLWVKHAEEDELKVFESSSPIVTQVEATG